MRSTAGWTASGTAPPASSTMTGRNGASDATDPPGGRRSRRPHRKGLGHRDRRASAGPCARRRRVRPLPARRDRRRAPRARGRRGRRRGHDGRAALAAPRRRRGLPRRAPGSPAPAGPGRPAGGQGLRRDVRRQHDRTRHRGTQRRRPEPGRANPRPSWRARALRSIASIEPGSPAAAEAKRVLVAEGMWSQYLEVGIGPGPRGVHQGPGPLVGRLRRGHRDPSASPPGTTRSRSSCWS